MRESTIFVCVHQQITLNLPYQVIVHIKPADTLGLTPERDYIYDAEIYTASDVYTFARNVFRVVQ